MTINNLWTSISRIQKSWFGLPYDIFSGIWDGDEGVDYKPMFI